MEGRKDTRGMEGMIDKSLVYEGMEGIRVVRGMGGMRGMRDKEFIGGMRGKSI